jgi:hypothetical protein
MASLNTIYIKAEVLKVLADTVAKKGDKGVELTISLSDEANQYGQNVSAYVSQTKEQREAKTPRYYVGNGKTYWTDGKITKREAATPVEDAKVIPADKDGLPF